MNKKINLDKLIETSTDEDFRLNLKNIVEKYIPIGERLRLYNDIANSIYTKGHTVFAIFSWELGLYYLDNVEIDNILKADLLRSYGLAWMELNHFDLSIEYLNQAIEFLDDSDDGILIDIYFGLSVVFNYLTNIPKAIEYAQMATQIANKMSDDFEISRAYLNTGNLFSKINQYNEAQENYENALKYANMDEVKSNIFMSLGLLHKNRLEYKKAEEMYQKAETIFFELKSVTEMFKLYINYGTLCTKLAKFDEGKDYLKRSLEYFEGIEDSHNTTICYLNLGRLEHDRAKFSKSLEYFDKAIELLENNKNLLSLASLLYYSRANLFLSSKESDKALVNYKKAIDYAQKENDIAMEASIKNAFAGIEADKGNIEKAKKIYQENIEVFENDNNIEEVIATYTNIALLHDELGMYQLAQKTYQKALDMSRDIDIPQLEISILINMAEMLGRIMNTSKAIELYNQALVLLEKYDNDDLLSKCYLNLANIYESITKFDLALKYAHFALSLKNKLGQDNTLYIVHDALARVYDGLGKEKEAEIYYLKALKESQVHNQSHHYGMLVNYGLFLFKFKKDIEATINCYDRAKEYFELHQKYETLIAINSNYAMLYNFKSDTKKEIFHYKKALEYSNKFLSLIEDETIMMKYRVNFEHIYENLLKLYIDKKQYKEAFDSLENLKSRSFSKILSSSYFESDKIPKNLLKKEKRLKSKLGRLFNADTEIMKLDSMLEVVYRDLNGIYREMKIFDENYVLVKENSTLEFMKIKNIL